MKILSFDAETDGLWGNVFSIGAVVMENGTATAEFYGRCEYDVKSDWVRENVLPNLPKPTHRTYAELLDAFADFYNTNRTDAIQVVHMGYIVESWLLRNMFQHGVIGEGDGPYPLHDLGTALECAKKDPTSQDAFFQAEGGLNGMPHTPGGAARFQYELPGHGKPHNPTFDAYVTAWCWDRLFRKSPPPTFPPHKNREALMAIDDRPEKRMG